MPEKPARNYRKNAAATSAHKHAKLHGLSSGGCGVAPPSVTSHQAEFESLSETGKRNADESCCGSWSAATTRGGSARAMKNASRALGSEAPARAGVCSPPPRTLPKMSERFVVRRKKRPQEARASLRTALRAQFVAWPWLARFRAT